MAKKATATKKTEKTESADGPILDLTDADVKKFIKNAKAKGYVTYDELNKVLPSEEVSSEQIEDIIAMINDMGINEVEHEYAPRCRYPAVERSVCGVQVKS